MKKTGAKKTRTSKKIETVCSSETPKTCKASCCMAVKKKKGTIC